MATFASACSLLGVSPAQAADAAPRAPEQRPQSAESPHRPRAEVLARGLWGKLGVGMLGVGVESTYSLVPHLGVGGVAEVFTVDNGADPDYSPAGRLSNGYHGLAFVEGDVWDGWLTPYGRVGLGLGNYERFPRHYPTERRLEVVAQLSIGLALRGGPLVLRVSASPSLYGRDALTTYSAALGARF